MTSVDFKYLICSKSLNKKKAAWGFIIWFVCCQCPRSSSSAYISEIKSNQIHNFISLCASSELSIWQGMAFLALYMLCRIVYSLEISSSIIILCVYISLAKLYHMYSCTIFLIVLSYKCGHMNHFHVSNYNTAK